MLGENLQTVRENAEIIIKASKDIGLEHGYARMAHCVTARRRNISHYCRLLRQYDVRLTCSEHREALTAAPRQYSVYTDKRLQ